MFCVVEFVGGRQRTVVPHTWLSINDTLCSLPPKATDSDLEALVRNLAEPGVGWQLLEVSSLETFESYSEAKKQLKKSEETSQSETSSQRKKKKLEDYETHDSGNGQRLYTVFKEEIDEEAVYEWVPSPEFSPRIENVSTVEKTIRNDHRPWNHRFSQSQLSYQKENSDITCDCQSPCHSNFLQALHSMQKQLDRTNQMVQKLLGGQKQTHSQLLRIIQSQSVNQMKGQEGMNVFLQDNTSFVQCLSMEDLTRQYHVTFGTSKRLITLKENDDLLKVIESTFKLNSSEIIIQQWNTEWEDWLDVFPNDLPECAKLKIEINQSTEPLPDVDSCQNDAFSEVMNIQPTYDLDANTNSESFILPMEYFTPGLLNCLKKGERLKKSNRTQLLNILYDAMSRKTLFPSKKDYRVVAEKLVKEFPALSIGIGMNDAVSLWRIAISDKFRNERRYERKRGIKRSKEMENPPATQEESPQNFWGIPVKNFLPPRAVGESNDSIEAHVEWLKLEYKKISKDNQLIAQKMDLTFPERRRLIVSESATVKTLKDTYPCLFEENQLLAEFGRLLSYNVEDVFLQNLRKYGPTIVKLTTRSKFGQYLTERLAAESDGVMRENTVAKAVPQLIAALVNEKSSCLLRSFSDESVMHPVILYEGERPIDAIRVQINLNNDKICEATDIPRAVILLIATYFVFGIEYPKEGHTTLQLIQHLLCNISSSARKTTKFSRNINLITASASITE